MSTSTTPWEGRCWHEDLKESKAHGEERREQTHREQLAVSRKLTAVTCDMDHNSVHAKLARVEPSSDVHAGVPGLHSGINLCTVFCSQAHGQSGERKNQRVFRCRLISGQWRCPPSFTFTHRHGEKW